MFGTAFLRGLLRCGGLAPINSAGGVHFPCELRALLQSAHLSRNDRDDGRFSRRQLLKRASKLEQGLDELITKKLSNDENRKVAGHIIEHRELSCPFLYHPGLEATNPHGEQSIRPAMVNRKM